MNDYFSEVVKKLSKNILKCQCRINIPSMNNKTISTQ